MCEELAYVTNNVREDVIDGFIRPEISTSEIITHHIGE
jgi:hypothetical protein